MRSLYDEVLLEHNNHPQFEGELPDGNVAQEVVNTSCGDKLVIEFKMEGEKVLKASWHGKGCAISQASADLMVGAITGKEWQEIEELYTIVEQLVTGEIKPERAKYLGDLAALGTVARMPARVKCAKLPWQIVEIASEVRNR